MKKHLKQIRRFFDLYLKYLEKTGRISYMEKVKKYV